MSGERLRDQRVVMLAAGFEAVNFAAQAGLSTIDAPGIQKHRTTYLAVRLIPFALFQHGYGYERANSPIKTHNPAFLLQGRDRLPPPFQAPTHAHPQPPAISSY